MGKVGTIDGTVTYAIDSEQFKGFASNKTLVFITVDPYGDASFGHGIFGDYSKTTYEFGSKTVTVTYPGDFKNGSTGVGIRGPLRYKKQNKKAVRFSALKMSVAPGTIRGIKSELGWACTLQ
ncbi:MAG: hypothetical protein LBT14_01050 [Treponema sp.]|jgi:hypothetical protein|nr:hypothetical protein [Treponema sp.]